MGSPCTRINIKHHNYYIRNVKKQTNKQVSTKTQKQGNIEQDAQLSQRDRAAGCVIVFAKSRTLELGDNDLRTL